MNPLLIFTHIPKTAGSTITTLIDTLYRKEEIHRESLDPAAGGPALDPRARILVGHHIYGQHRFTERPCRYFTILRDPVERVISVYFFILRKPDHFLYRQLASGEMSMLQLAQRERNVQTHYISGIPRTQEATEETLALAKKHLEERFVCGLMERFDESLLLLQNAYGWNFQSYRTINVTKNRPARDNVPAEVRAAAVESTRLDQQLYDWARERFEREIAAQPADFPQRLERLRARTARMAKYYTMKEQAWSWLRRHSGAKSPSAKNQS